LNIPIFISIDYIKIIKVLIYIIVNKYYNKYYKETKYIYNLKNNFFFNIL